MNKSKFSISGNVIDLENERIYKAEISIQNGGIMRIREKGTCEPGYILPGFVDAHVHIESSMLTPAEFAREAIKKGTVAAVADPHEIANVLGEKGIRFMIENGKKVPFGFYFGVPSCVPATEYETSGARLENGDIEKLLQRKDIHFLGEVMNFPAVVSGDKKFRERVALAAKYGKKADGHAPGLRGEDLQIYISAGIQTDHECTDPDEAREKIESGMKIIIREGSAAGSFDGLCHLIDQYPESTMLCCDDIHPDDLIKGHIERMVKKGIQAGLDLFNILRAASKNPVEHYGLDTGLLREGDPADFIVVSDLKSMKVLKTCIKGNMVFDRGSVQFPKIEKSAVNHFNPKPVQKEDIQRIATQEKMRVIEAFDKQLYTAEKQCVAGQLGKPVGSDTERDILKVIVVNRYKPAKPSVGFVKNFGLQGGALGSSVAHDSHNIIVAGVEDHEILRVTNKIIEMKGGIAAGDENEMVALPLPVAGLMALDDAPAVARQYDILNKKAASMGCRFTAPFMTLSFLSLLVIPKLKIGDRGLFNVDEFAFTELFVTPR